MKRKAEPSAELGLAVEQPGDSMRTPITVGALTTQIRDVLEENLGEVWVAGEISNFRSPGSGHLYFTLKDASATLAAVMFRQEAARSGFALRDGMAVIARGSITVYEARGQYQLQVAEIHQRGQGTLQQRFEELKRRLQAEGLFELERKRELPAFPETVGVVTSLQGAVLQDMLRILARRAPGIRILVRGVRVQGMGAEHEIAAAVRTFSAENKVDVLIVARGGGSLEDLWCFNEEVVARALFDAPMPTISAVGHETDFTIADFVADLRAPTPSAAAELLTRDWSDWRETVATLHRRMDRHVRTVLTQHRRHLTGLAESYALREPRRVVRQMAQRIDDLRQVLGEAAKRALRSRRDAIQLLKTQLQGHQPKRELARRRAHVEQLAARLRALGPQATLDRGYALVLDRDGKPVRAAKPALAGQTLRVALSKGALDAAVSAVHAGAALDDILQPPPTAPPAKKPHSRRPRPARPRGLIPDTLLRVRLLLAACILLGALSWARADDDTSLREDGVLYFQDNLQDRLVLAVKAPTVLYSRRDFGTQLGLFLPGQKIEIVGISPEGYLVKGDYRNNAVTGWITSARLPPGLDPKLIEKAKKNQDRHDKVAKAIKAKKVLRGMTPPEVEASLGRPEQTSSHDDATGQSLVWTYTTYASQWQTAPVTDYYGRSSLRTYLAKVPVGQMIITFGGGVVTAIEDHKTDPSSPGINAGG